MANEIDILVVEPGEAPRPAKAEDTLEAFQQIVGGPIEAGCYLPQRVMLVCNSEGKNMGLPLNRTIPMGRNNGVPAEAQRSGFGGERRSKGTEWILPRRYRRDLPAVQLRGGALRLPDPRPMARNDLLQQKLELTRRKEERSR